MSANVRDRIDSFEGENIKAETFIQNGDLPSAAAILVDIVKKDSKNARAYNSMGIISWQQEAWEDAYASFLHSVELQPTYTDAIVNLFDASLKLRKCHEILPVLKGSLEISPNDEEISVLCETIESQGDDIYTSQRALEIGFHRPELDKANELLEEGKLFAAMEIYLDIVDKEGPNAEAYNGLGIVAFYQKNFKDAFSMFYESIKLNPFSRDTYINLFDAASECETISEALKIYNFYLNEFPSLIDVKEKIEEFTKKD